MATNIMIRSGTTFGLVNFAGNLPGFLTPILNSALIKVIFTHNCCRLNSAYRMIIVCKTRYISIMPNDPTRLYIWPHDQGHDHDHEELSTAWGHFWWILAGQVNHVSGCCRGEICPCRHCRRQCKIFTRGVNFSRSNVIYYINESKKHILSWFYL